MTRNNVPIPTLERLSTYLRALASLEERGVEMICSSEMEQETGISAAQFRKDLSYFGEFGKPGIGYFVADLQRRIEKILKLDRQQSVLLVGAGNLGTALAVFPGWKQYRFSIAAVFDNNLSKIGRKLWDLEIQDMRNLVQINQELEARIGIIAVPAAHAQDVANLLISGGIKVILNFAPATLRAPHGIAIRNVCFIQELAVLSYFLGGEPEQPEQTPSGDESLLPSLQ